MLPPIIITIILLFHGSCRSGGCEEKDDDDDNDDHFFFIQKAFRCRVVAGGFPSSFSMMMIWMHGMELPSMWTKPNLTFPDHSKLYLGTTMFKNNEITFLNSHIFFFLYSLVTTPYFSSLSSLSNCLIRSQKANVSSTFSPRFSSNPSSLLMMTYYA